MGAGVGGGGPVPPHVPLPNSEVVVRAPSTQLLNRELQPHSPAQLSEHKIAAQPCGCGVGGAANWSVGGDCRVGGVLSLLVLPPQTPCNRSSAVVVPPRRQACMIVLQPQAPVHSAPQVNTVQSICVGGSVGGGVGASVGQPGPSKSSDAVVLPPWTHALSPVSQPQDPWQVLPHVN